MTTRDNESKKAVPVNVGATACLQDLLKVLRQLNDSVWELCRVAY